MYNYFDGGFMEKYELNKFISEYSKKLDDLYQAFLISSKRKELEGLNKEIQADGFWNDQKKAQDTISRLNAIKDSINQYDSLNNKFNDIKDNIELALNDSDLMAMLEDEIESFKKELEESEKNALLSGKYDFNNCILELHPGAGGTESMDWALMLYRMYSRYFNLKGYKESILEYQAGSEAGIKSISIEVNGPFAYGRLKGERGVHRLVRISPFDSSKARHTSFCSCDVTPIIESDSSIEIKDEDLKIDVFHSSGAGGQSVNTTDSAVRITHKPTGIVVTCQNERSQIKNKEFAMNVLRSKLMNLEIKKREEELNSEKGSQMKIDFGSQIRSYVFTPYTLVKDHRSEYSENNVESVMNGNLDGFIDAYLKFIAGEKNE